MLSSFWKRPPERSLSPPDAVRTQPPRHFSWSS